MAAVSSCVSPMSHMLAGHAGSGDRGRAHNNPQTVQLQIVPGRVWARERHKPVMRF
jgi:hypothetical protein